MDNYTYTGQKLWYQQHILNSLPYFVKFLKDHSIKFWADWGTLLGALRNGKMIPWDYDIDFGMFNDDALKMLSLSDEVNADGYEFSIDRNPQHIRVVRFFAKEVRDYDRSHYPGYHRGFEFHIDIDPCFADGDRAVFTANLNKSRPLSEVLELEEIEFEGMMLPCPKNPISIMESSYGPDWRTPKVLSGNFLFASWYDPENTEIITEMKKYKGC